MQFPNMIRDDSSHHRGNPQCAVDSAEIVVGHVADTPAAMRKFWQHPIVKRYPIAAFEAALTPRPLFFIPRYPT